MEKRLDELNHLKSKYGNSIEEIFLYKRNRVRSWNSFRISRHERQNYWKNCGVQKQN